MIRYEFSADLKIQGLQIADIGCAASIARQADGSWYVDEFHLIGIN